MKVLLAHGSSNERHGEQVQKLAQDVSDILGEQVGYAFLSDAPDVPAGAEVFPLFLGQGKHVKEDVPAWVDAAGAIALPPLSHHADVLADWVINQLTKETRRIRAMFVIYRFAGFERLLEGLYNHAGRCTGHAMASLHGIPKVDDVLVHWRQQGVKQVVLQPILLFAGHSLDECRTLADVEGAEIQMMPPLAELDGFATLIAQCLQEDV